MGLYSDLRKVEMLGEKLEETHDQCQSSLEIMSEKYNDGLDLDFTFPSIDVIDVPSTQKGLFDVYKGNFYLREAIDCSVSIEKSLSLLDKKFRGWRRYVPHRKDNEHNRQVEEFGEIVSTDHLETRGILNLRNSMILGLGGVVSGVMGVLFYGSMSHPTNIPGWEDRLPYVLSAGAVCSAMAIGFPVYLINQSKKEISFDQAKYIDKKIEEFF